MGEKGRCLGWTLSSRWPKMGCVNKLWGWLRGDSGGMGMERGGVLVVVLKRGGLIIIRGEENLF